MKNAILALTLIGGVLTTATPLSASTLLRPSSASIIVGESYGYTCYTNASLSRTSLQAIDACNKALDEETLNAKDRAATFVNRGVMRANRGDIEGAIGDYRRALALKSNLGDAFANIGTAYLQVDRYAEALPMLQKALEFEQLARPANVHFNLAIAQEELGDLKAAYFNLKKAAEINPDWDSPIRELQRYRVISR